MVTDVLAPPLGGGRAAARGRAWLLAKIDANRARDRRAVEQMSEMEWPTAIIWECVTRDAQALGNELGRLFGTRVDAPCRVAEDSESKDRRTA